MKWMMTLLLTLLMLTLASCDDEYASTETERTEVYMDAITIENAAKLYCAAETCSLDMELTWNDLETYVSDIDENDYDFSVNAGYIAVLNEEDWEVYLERSGTGDWEFPLGYVPTLSDPIDVEEDVN